MITYSQETLSNIVLNDHRTATVLEKHRLDFCCRGKRTLLEACGGNEELTNQIVTELESAAGDACAIHMPFSEMTADQLIAHILVHHHFYVKKIMAPLCTHLEKVAVKHGSRYPHMIEVFQLFVEVSNEMAVHMQKEENILFPAIKQAEAAYKSNSVTLRDRSVIEGATVAMETEHDHAGELMRRINELTKGYTAPQDACTTHRLSLAELKHFEEDLHIHVNLENNLLFPLAKKFIV